MAHYRVDVEGSHEALDEGGYPAHGLPAPDGDVEPFPATRREDVRPQRRSRSGRGRSVLACLALGFMQAGAAHVAAYANAATPDGPAQDPKAIVRACVQREMAQGGILGAAVGVALDGQIVMTEGFGRKHKDRSDPVDADTQFRIGSSTKMLTAAGMLRLVDRGLVDLDAPLSRYVPEVRFAEPGVEDRVTIRDLLQHTSGLPDNSATQESDLYGQPDPTALGRWVLAQGATVPHNPPGRFWNYASANYMYAGHVIERVSGLSFQDYMQREVFEPAGMHDTTMVASEVEARGNFAYGHWNDLFHGGLDIWKPTDQDNWARHPTGYAHSTVGDLVRWASLLMDGGGKVLSPASARLMASPLVFRDLGADQYYGFGLFSNGYKSLALKYHPGSAWGWMATVDWVPERRFAVATLTNGFGALYSSASCALDAFLKPADAPPPGGSCPQDRADWPSLVGHYAGETYVGTPWQFDVGLRAGVPYLTVTRADGTRASTAMSQDCGLARANGPGSFNVDTDGNGTVDQMVTFIHDPVEPGVVWLRNRLFVLRRAAPAETPTASPTPTPSSTPAPTAQAVTETVYLPWLWAGR
jgi:CubicO group peptidase (beta-lactamase class C family)